MKKEGAEQVINSKLAMQHRGGSSDLRIHGEIRMIEGRQRNQEKYEESRRKMDKLESGKLKL